MPPPLPPFDCRGGAVVAGGGDVTAPLDVMEPALVISAVTSAALVTWASDEAPEPVNRPRESASALAVAVLVPVAVIADRAGGGDRAADRGEHRALDPCGRQGHADAEPERGGAGVGLGQGDVRAGGGHGDGTGDGDRATGHGGGHVRVLADVRERGRRGARRQGRTGRPRWSRTVAVLVWVASTVREAADGTEPPKSAVTPASTNAYETMTVPATKPPPAAALRRGRGRVVLARAVRSEGDRALAGEGRATADLRRHVGARGDDGLGVGTAGAGRGSETRSDDRGGRRGVRRPEPPSTRRPRR